MTAARLVTRHECPFCGGPQHVTIFSLPFGDPRVQDYLHSYYGGRVDARFDGDYTLDRCLSCGGMWQRHILDAAGSVALYERWIDPQASLDKRRTPVVALELARRVARLRRLLRSDHTRVLDYGMGWGDFCRMAHAFGFDVTGVELSTERVAAAETRGTRAFLPDTLPDETFDYIELEQVLEHVPSPGETLRMLVGRLRPGGYLHVGVPDGRDVERDCVDPSRLLRKGPAQPLEHINIFTPATLRGLLRQLGCAPAAQREVLIRPWPPLTFARDLGLAAARHLPASMFPGGTNLLVRKSDESGSTRP